MPMGWPIRPRPISPTLVLELAADSTDASHGAIRLIGQAAQIAPQVSQLKLGRFYSITTQAGFLGRRKERQAVLGRLGRGSIAGVPAEADAARLSASFGWRELSCAVAAECPGSSPSDFSSSRTIN